MSTKSLKTKGHPSKDYNRITIFRQIHLFWRTTKDNKNDNSNEKQPLRTNTVGFVLKIMESQLRLVYFLFYVVVYLHVYHNFGRKKRSRETGPYSLTHWIQRVIRSNRTSLK